MKLRYLFLILGIIFLSHADSGLARERAWKQYPSRNVIVFYDKASIDFVKTVESTAENYYKEIYRNFGFGRYMTLTGEERIKIYIYDDADDYVVSGKQANWSHGAASPIKKEIRTFPTAHGFFDSTLPHEIGHIVFRQYVGYKPEIPLWFEEGVAMYQEQAKRYGSHEVVKQAIKNNLFISVVELNKVQMGATAKKELIDLFYAESASIVNYLIVENGQQRFVKMCNLIRDGESFESALSKAYIRFKDLEKLNLSWIKFIQ